MFPKNEVKDQLKNGVLTVTVKITMKLLSRTVVSGEPTFNKSGLTSGMTTQTRATQTTIATQNTQNILGQNIQTQGQKTQNLEKTQKAEVTNQMSTSHKIPE